MIRKTWKSLVILFVLLFLYLPILVLMVYSFTDATNIGAIRGLSLHNYVTLFTTPELVGMILGTVILALTAALLATIPEIIMTIATTDTSGRTSRIASICLGNQR